MATVKLEELQKTTTVAERIKILEDRLSELAAAWGRLRGNETKRKKIQSEYRSTMETLYELGWDGVLDAESHLPDEHMPPIRTERHPRPKSEFGTLRAPKK